MTHLTQRPRSNSHRDLIVWQKAIDLAINVNRVTRAMPSHERYELSRQMRSAAISIAANIAEGRGRNQPRDYARFLAIARGSARELDTYFVLAKKLHFVGDADLRDAESLLDEIGRMLTTLMRRIAPL